MLTPHSFCATRHQAAILPVLGKLVLHPESDLAADAHSLGSRWAELEEVAVIEKLAGTADPIEFAVPRRRMSAFRESTLRQIERETGAQLSLTKNNNDPEHRMLKIAGTQQDIDSAREALEQALDVANAEAAAEEARKQAAAHAATSSEERKRSLDGTNGGTDGRSDAPLSVGARSTKRVRTEDGLPEGWRKTWDKTHEKW